MFAIPTGRFGTVRVMVNCNQMGEAAVTACRLALQDGRGVAEIVAERSRRTPAAGGSAILYC